MTDIQLISPAEDLHASWLESAREWGGSDAEGWAHQAGAGLDRALRLGLRMEDPKDFAAWVRMLVDEGDTSKPTEPGRVHAENLWIAEGEGPERRYLGALQIRHALANEVLAELIGHIGYGVRPSARGRGVASAALKLALQRARELGIEHLLITCDDSNTASAKTAESAGAVLESIRQPDELARSCGYEEPLRRYWISLG